VISSASSFLVYPILTQACGAEYVEVPMKDFRYDLKGILDRITERTRLIFIANPNNPTGTYVNRDEVENFIEVLGYGAGLSRGRLKNNPPRR